MNGMYDWWHLENGVQVSGKVTPIWCHNSIVIREDSTVHTPLVHK